LYKNHKEYKCEIQIITNLKG